ncbi:PAS domain S-box protein [Pseudomonadota bacterium]
MSRKKNIDNNANHLEAIARTTTDALIAIDDAGNVISWNYAAEKIFGYSADEMIGESMHSVIPERFRALHDEGLKRVNAGGEHHVIGHAASLAGCRKDGTEFPLELTLSTWKSGGKNHFGGIIRDISERLIMEERLHNSEEMNRSIAETASDGIITADVSGNILSWNQAATRIFGYDKDEVIGKPLTIIIPDQHKAAHDQGIQRVAGGGKTHVIGNTAELSGLHKEGNLIPVELSLSTWLIGEERYFSGIIRDITQRKKDEEKLLQQKKKLQSRARSLKKLNEEVKTKNEQLEALSNKLAKYLSRQVYQHIFEGKSDVKIESYRKKLTVFFSDIQGFTELTDRVESEVLTGALNKYLNEMSKIALDHGGTIDKFIGDAIMIFFGDPETLGEKEDAIACVTMAIAMRKKLAEMRREWDVLGISTPLHVRMGINTGFCTVGNFGSEERLDYTIVGGSVNLASRLESAADVDEVLISEDTFSLIKDVIVCVAKEEINVKGIAYPIKTYSVVDLVETIEVEHEQIKAQLKGFKLNIDFEKLNYSDKLYAREMLQKAMARLETNVDD